MTYKQKIKKILDRSKEVIKDCALENGAIVAANTDEPYVPREAKDYRYVWPRDAAFICKAANLLGMKITEPYLDWLYKRPEDFKKDKILYSNYSTNGRIGPNGKTCQIDQMGASLWLICDYYKKEPNKAFKYKDLIERLANGICEQWEGRYFHVNVIDLWEEAKRKTSTKVENNHTYSLAACAKGLICANELKHNHLWQKCAMEMINEIDEAYDKKNKYFLRTAGKINDYNIDASMLGLAYPFEIIDVKDKRMKNTVDRIEKKLTINGGIHRYRFDYYDGEGSASEGGGGWPLINCWMAIYWVLAGDKKKARKYYDWVINNVEKFNYYIPEQIFDDFRIGIYPLAWAHAMFVIASKYLGYLK